MFTDMVGYTALGQRNESLSLTLVEEQRKIIRPILSRYDGREIKTMGDAFLVEFTNALDAVKCAYDIQRATREFNVPLPAERRIHLKVGLHLGDVVESQGDISGDAVNVASRVYPLAEDGGVCITRQVYDQVKGKFELPQVSIGPKALKNVSEPVEVFRVVMPWEQPDSSTVAFPRDRVAILPFRSMSPDPNDEYFAEGMTEEIISTVSGISGLKVISRTSVMGYKGTTKKVEEIGRELKVGSVLEGSFRKAGNRIRVTTQLIDVADDEHLWAQNYDRNLDDVFEVQSDVAKQVADALKVKILSSEKERIERKPTDSTTAYTLYLKGRYLWNKRGLEDLKKAAETFEQVVKEDPTFALGYVGAADSYLTLRNNYGIDVDANLERAKRTVTKALELDPGLAEAHATKGLMLRHEYNLRQAEEEFKKAIELKPGYAMAHMWYHIVLLDQLRSDEALEQIQKAVELDPLSPVINIDYGSFYYYRKDYSKALEFFRRSVELGYVAGHGFEAFAYGKMKMFDDATREVAIWVEHMQGSFPSARVAADAIGAWLKDDRQTLKRLLPEFEEYVRETSLDSYFIASPHFYLGELDKGFEWLERAYSEKLPSLMDIQWDDNFDGIRTDPRYLDLLRRLGLK
jgi:TolB-like protein/Tfp pilus assembly protein PilF